MVSIFPDHEIEKLRGIAEEFSRTPTAGFPEGGPESDSTRAGTNRAGSGCGFD
jgi:hypothetical protein